MDRQYGRPGRHASHLARQAGWRAARPVLASLGGAGLLLAFPAGPLVVRALLGAVAVALAAATRGPDLDARGRALAGSRAERRVGRILSRRAGGVVLHGVLVDRRLDADHVVVGPDLWAVETKSGGGPIAVGRNGRLHAGSKHLRGTPHRQAAKVARQLSTIVGRPVRPAVCIAGGEGQQVVDGVLVCGPETLAGHIAACERLPSATVRDIVAELVGRVDDQ